jgi:hypothetical protein
LLQSSIAWIDFSEQDRRNINSIISHFGMRDTRDELGLGSVRDAFADLFFPGTTTLQTRARYFLFVPWIYRSFEKRRTSSHQVPRRLKSTEIRLIDALKAADEEGIIGGISGASLQRFPSGIYWNGLEQWGIRRFPGSQSQYVRWLDRFYELQGNRPRREDGDLIGGYEANWDPDLPPVPEHFPNQADLCLTLKEARYLRERLLLSCPNSLLTTIVDRCRSTEEIHFVWQHPQLSLFPDEQQTWIAHARNFSEVMYGAALVYNLMLSELRQHDEWTEAYREGLSGWWGELDASTGGLAEWDRDSFWDLVKKGGRTVPMRTRHFTDRWIDLLLSAQGPADLSQHADARHLVREREIWLKGRRSRFKSMQHREMWSGGSSANQLDFRWRIARRITNDILHGLGTDKE